MVDIPKTIKGVECMSFCAKCGREIMDETLGCPVCSMMEEPVVEEMEAEVEKVDEFTVEDEEGNKQHFERMEDNITNDKPNANFQATNNAVEQTIPTVLKVIIIIAILLVGGVGQIAGLIAGVTLMKSPIEDYRKFGKTLMILSCVLLGIWLVCCIFGTAFNSMALIAGSLTRWF